MEKAAQMRAERKLAATGEMALGTKTNYGITYVKYPKIMKNLQVRILKNNIIKLI